jgi:hypothetical protein
MKDFKLPFFSEELFKPILVLILKFDYFLILFNHLKGPFLVVTAVRMAR